MPMNTFDEKEVELKRIEASIKIAQIQAATQIVTTLQNRFSIELPGVVKCWNEVYSAVKKG